MSDHLPSDMILRNCRIINSSNQLETTDISTKNGRFTAIGPHLPISADQEIDMKGKFASPPFVESHIHLDSALTLKESSLFNQSGTLIEGIELWKKIKKNATEDSLRKRVMDAIRMEVEQGVLFFRANIDVTEPGLTALKVLLDIKKKLKELLTIQITAFPQDGILNNANNIHLLEEAVQSGADVIGGIPHYELTREDGIQSIESIFTLAEKYSRLIDIHCDETDDEQSRFLEVVAAHSIRREMSSKVTASHTSAFSSYNNAYAFKLMNILKRAKINFVSNPLINITLQGRHDTYPKRRGLTRLKELWEEGMNISLGHDCLQDPWYQLGRGNMLDAAYMAVHTAQMTSLEQIEACFDMITYNGAKTLSVQEHYGIETGKPANLIVLDAGNRFEAVRLLAPVLYIFAKGKLIFSKKTNTIQKNEIKNLIK